VTAGVPSWYGALTALLEPIGARWGQGGDPVALRARRALDVPLAETWIHAASVGEASGLPPLLAEWRRRRPDETVALSAMTPGGRAALARLGDLEVTAPPYDAPGPARRAVRTSGLRRLVLLETEIWPAWIEAALSENARVAFVNARLSDRSWPMYRRIAGSLAPLLARVTAVAAQTEIDAGRWRSLGVPADRVRVTGNTKHEAMAAVEPPTAAEKAEARRRLDLDEGQVWCVWASLRPGEEQWLRKAMPLVPPGTRFLVVPRHPDRWRKAYRPGEGYGEVVWLLSLGVLPEALRACDLAIMGGTLARYGGHNPVEPAALGLPVVLGPSTENVREAAEALIAAGAARRVTDAADLAQAVGAWVCDADSLRVAGEAARRVVAGLAGASARTLDWLEARGFWA